MLTLRSLALSARVQFVRVSCLILVAVMAPAVNAALTPGFDAVVVRAEEAPAERAFEASLMLIASGNYRAALQSLRKIQVDYPGYSRLSAVQTRVAVLHEAADAGESLAVFLRALDSRDGGRLNEALALLDSIATDHPRSSLMDDALYLGAYLSVMDGYDFDGARTRLANLEQRFPDSAYSDSAAYLAAIVAEQLGDTAGARQRLIDLRDKHTALGLPFGFRWPVGNVMSRYWFDRAERRIGIIDRRLKNASRVASQKELDDGRLRVAVNVEGIDMQLLLSPSTLVSRTDWHDASLSDQLPPDIGIYEGHVEGSPGSWVRATIDASGISGMIHVNGRRVRLLPGHLTGTLDYYQPASRHPAAASAKGFDPTDPSLANQLMAIDLLRAPPRRDDSVGGRRATTQQTATRAVPLSIVVDSQFDAYHAGAGLARALDHLNVADGVYREHGLALTLDEAVTFSAGEDPLRLDPGTLESFLRKFRTYRMAHSTLFADSAATYLFTGNQKTDVTLGLAWIDTLCRTDGFDVGVTTPSSFGDVLLTHELGHSFGAQHDSDTSCASDNGGLMWPHISERTPTRLTSCSSASVRAARTRSCLLNTIDMRLDAEVRADTVVFGVTNTESTVGTDARVTVETGVPGQVVWPDNCLAVSPTSAECLVDTIGPRERRELHLQFDRQVRGIDAPLSAEVSPIGVVELTPADNKVTTDGGTLVAGVSDDSLPRPDPVGSTTVATAASVGDRPVLGSGSGGGAIAPLGASGLALMAWMRHRRQLSGGSATDGAGTH